MKRLIQSTRGNWHSWVFGSKMCPNIPKSISSLCWLLNRYECPVGSCLCWSRMILDRRGGRASLPLLFQGSALDQLLKWTVCDDRTVRFSGGFPEPRSQRLDDIVQAGCPLKHPGGPRIPTCIPSQSPQGAQLSLSNNLVSQAAQGGPGHL